MSDKILEMIKQRRTKILREIEILQAQEAMLHDLEDQIQAKEKYNVTFGAGGIGGSNK